MRAGGGLVAAIPRVSKTNYGAPRGSLEGAESRGYLDERSVDMKEWVFGFDLSLTAPACVALPLDWRPGDWESVAAFLLKPKTLKIGNVAGQLSRYATISNWAHDCIEKATSMPLGTQQCRT
jgi:hypothetical protein